MTKRTYLYRPQNRATSGEAPCTPRPPPPQPDSTTAQFALSTPPRPPHEHAHALGCRQELSGLGGAALIGASRGWAEGVALVPATALEPGADGGDGARARQRPD